MGLASHLRIVLSHREFTKKTICKLIYASFDDLRVESVNNAKWDKGTQCTRDDGYMTSKY